MTPKDPNPKPDLLAVVKKAQSESLASAKSTDLERL